MTDFSADVVSSHLTTRHLGRTLHLLEQTDSTNTVLARLARERAPLAADSPLALEDESSLPSERDLAFDAIMTGLRRLDIGVPWTATLARYFDAAARAQEAVGRLVYFDTASGPRVRLTDEGLRFMDDVLLALLEADEP